MTKDAVEKFFERYEQFYMQSLKEAVDATEISELYAPEFIGASPFGVMTAKNDANFRQALEQGYEQYRKIGTKEMRVCNIEVLPIDELHCIARVSWRATYETAKCQNIEIDFDVHYLMQEQNGKLNVFGWISGDEQSVLKEQGVL